MAPVLIYFYAFFYAFLSAASPAQADSLSYGRAQTDALLFLHAYIDYEFGPDWQREYERQALSRNIAFSTYGSISKRELLYDETILLNHELGGGWWFRGQFTWYESRHLDTDESTRFVGLQKEILPGFLLSAMGDFRRLKDDIDTAFGFVLLDRNREKYFWADVVINDIYFDDRTYSTGRTVKSPLGFRWQLRQTRGPLTVVTSGNYTRGFSRVFGLAEAEGLTRHDRRQADGTIAVYLSLRNRALLECRFSGYQFEELKEFQAVSENYRYHNTIRHAVARYLRPWSLFDQVRFELHGVQQHSRARGSPDYRYDRREFLSALFLEKSWGRNLVEIGYMGSVYHWDSRNRTDPRRSDTTTDYIDKGTIGWSCRFSEDAAFHASLSHVFNFQAFGGGNGQFMLFF